MLTLIIGGARSGKSRFAQSLCANTMHVAYIATARVEDEEMRARVARHRQERPANWTTYEEPLELGSVLRRAQQEHEILLVDCLTVWLSNFLYQHRRSTARTIEDAVMEQIADLAKAAPSRQVILVSNEVGGGIVPATKIGRLFRDLQGLVNQRVAAEADRVFLTVAGIPIPIKPASFLPISAERSNNVF